MKLRRIRTTEAARALDIHPQTIRNLWAKDEVPRLYLMALTTYVWALGMDPKVMAAREAIAALSPQKRRDVKRVVEHYVPEPLKTQVVKDLEQPIEKKESTWKRLS